MPISEYAIHFDFALQQEVVVLPLKVNGRVLARCDRGHGFLEYRVVYWYDGKRCDEWLLACELKGV